MRSDKRRVWTKLAFEFKLAFLESLVGYQGKNIRTLVFINTIVLMEAVQEER